MEQQEEKKSLTKKQEEKKRKEHIRRRRRRQSKSTLSFPIDLTSEILLRLPLKSFVRFRCVSKLWSSIINDPYFINLFETRSPWPSLLLCFRKDDNMFVYSIPQHSKISNKSYSFSQPTDQYQMTFPRYRCNSFTESVHCLICFLGSDETPMLWNPSKRRLLTLPKPSKISLGDDIRVFLGYEPIEGKHKLVCVSLFRDCDVCQVLTLGSAQESWRIVKTNHKLRYNLHSPHGRGRCIKGVLYCEAYNYMTRVHVIMSFDVRYEIFDMIQLPSDIDNGLMMMTTYEGKLACVKKKRSSYDTIKLYILEDAEKHEWSCKDFLALFSHFDQSLGTYFDLIGITHAGEFIYAPSRFRKSYCIFFYDPVRNSSRRFEFKGIADDEYWLSDEPWLYLFPNHIESLRSF